MALNIDAKFKGKMTCAFKNDIKNLVNMHRLKQRRGRIISNLTRGETFSCLVSTKW